MPTITLARALQQREAGQYRLLPAGELKSRNHPPPGQSGTHTKHEKSQRMLYSAISSNVKAVKKKKRRGPPGLTATYSCVNAIETQINMA